jgi:hypothetical protein
VKKKAEENSESEDERPCGKIQRKLMVDSTPALSMTVIKAFN